MCRKKPMRASWQPPPDHRWQQQELIVVNPNRIATSVLLADCLRKCFVDVGVRLPTGGVDGDSIDLIMKERPQNAIREAVAVPDRPPPVTDRREQWPAREGAGRVDAAAPR